MRAARTAAAIERADAIELNQTTKTALQASGTTITVFSAEDQAAFVAAVQSVHDSFGLVFGNLVPAGN
jgi:TRAP-type C4-dicarboxylate transport system substrate-binding protein